MSVNRLKITIPDEVLDEREETDEELNNQKKLAKKMFVGEILKNVCALHNSNGGTLELFSPQQCTLNLDKIVRPVEELSQHIMFNIPEILENFKIDVQTKNSIILHIQGSPSLTTMRYNIFLPTETQVLELLPVNSKLEVRQRMDRKICEPNQDKVPADFIFGNSSGLQESQTVQFKNLKTEATSNTTFIKRVIHNKFTRYVSAFANHRGGRIYYGIKDDGVVAGEELSDEEKVRVENRIENVIGKMCCHGASGSSRVERELWDITFTPVKDNAADQRIIKSTFVMIVSIKPFYGVVFTKQPKSYCIEGGKVVKINFDDWLVHFKMGNQPWPILVMPRCVSHVQWSSKRDRDIYIYFIIGLVESRNDNDTKKFECWKELAKSDQYKTTDASFIVRSEMVAVHYKRHEFKHASTLVKRLRDSLKNHKQNKDFHEAKVLYLESRIERAKGNYEKSYKLARRCLQIVTKLPAEFITVWCYMQLAMLANIFGASQNDSTKFSEAQQWLQLALRDACTLKEFPTGLLDVQQKIFIYRAMTLLKCSLIGGISNLDVSPEDINASVHELSKVDKSFMKGNHMSQYREIQYLFAQCSLFLRHSEHTKSLLKRHEYMKRAQRWVDQAKHLATECGFNDMEGYATSFQEIVHRLFIKLRKN